MKLPFLGLLLVTFALHGAPPDAALSSEILYADAGRRQAVFLPASTLERPVRDLPLDQGTKGVLEMIVARAEVFGEEPQRCSRDLHTWRGKSNGKQHTLAQLIALSKDMVVGDVVAVVPGWSARRLGASTLVWVRVSSVVQSRNTRIREGQLIAFLCDHGTVKIHGATFCSDREIEPPAIGTRLLLDVASLGYAGEPRLVQALHWFEILNGDVEFSGYVDLEPFDKQNLNLAIDAARDLKARVK